MPPNYYYYFRDVEASLYLVKYLNRIEATRGMTPFEDYSTKHMKVSIDTNFILSCNILEE